ncbi:MAG: LacI family DNA-binding transcriptional regulator [Bacteroidota bacterium]
MRRRPTIRDVAKKAGLSLSTVSLVLNKKGYVSEPTKEKVLSIIKELDYHPQPSARGLASKLSGNIGFILTDEHFSQSEPFYTRIFLGSELEARKHNYYILLATVGKNIKQTDGLPRFLFDNNVDGVIIAGKIGISWIDYIAKKNIPLVLIDFVAPRISSITIDNKTGAELVMQHFLEGGHKKIGFIGGDIKHPSVQERYLKYRSMLVNAGIPPNERWENVDQANTTMADGYEAAKKIFSHNENKPTALFAANDAMGIGCMRYLTEKGLKVPNDVAIVGFDNIEAGLHVDPPLTTVNVHREEMGSLAVRRMVEIIKDKSAIVTKTVTPVELVLRESCGIKPD